MLSEDVLELLADEGTQELPLRQRQLKVLDQESSVTLKLTDGESAAVFTTDDDYTYVIMPLARDR